MNAIGVMLEELHLAIPVYSDTQWYDPQYPLGRTAIAKLVEELPRIIAGAAVCFPPTGERQGTPPDPALALELARGRGPAIADTTKLSVDTRPSSRRPGPPIVRASGLSPEFPTMTPLISRCQRHATVSPKNIDHEHDEINDPIDEVVQPRCLGRLPTRRRALEENIKRPSSYAPCPRTTASRTTRMG